MREKISELLVKGYLGDGGRKVFWSVLEATELRTVWALGTSAEGVAKKMF